MKNETEQLNFLNEEIINELQPIPPEDLKKVGRKEFVVTSLNPIKDKDKEMAVFTHAKKLAEYIFIITEKAPKKLRWSIVLKLQNTSMNIVENLYFANIEENKLIYQKKAKVSLELLDFYTETAKRLQAINSHQMFVIAKQIFEVKKLLGGWMRSVKRNNSL